jgi:ribosomal protein S18 acetylase RimI-like enzyme
MDIRLYSLADRAACLEVFDSNAPQFFHPLERASFEAFLDAMDCAYFVIGHESRVAGCGGYAVSEDKSMASLVWGMVRSDLHKLGFGRFLLLFRLRRISQTNSVSIVRLGTSQHAVAFFEKHGFKAASVKKDGYAPGIDRIEMMMKLVVCA